MLSRERVITTIMCKASTSVAPMSATEHHPEIVTDISLPKHELLEVTRSKISLHRAKVGYYYPTIRLLHTFSQLAGLSTRIYQTIYDGSLAFLTVISPTENASKTPKSSVFIRRRSPVRIRPMKLFFLQSDTQENSIGASSDTRIMTKKKHNRVLSCTTAKALITYRAG